MNNNKKPLWIALIAVALVGICVSIFLFVPDTNTAKGAVHCDEATEEGQNAYIDMVGIASYPFATYDGYEKLGLYFAFDEDFVYYIVAMEGSKISNYKEQTAYYLSDTDDYMPAPVRLTGKAYAIDSEIKELALDVVGGGSITEDNFADMLGVYFLNTNVSATSSGSFLAAVIVLFVSIALLAVGLYNFLLGEGIAYDEGHRYGLAIACGVFGLIVASLIPMAIGMFLKKIMIYALIAVPLGFFIGYNLIEKVMKLPTKIIFVLLSTFMGFVSMYMVYAWNYYEYKKEGSFGISFMQAASTLLDNLDAYESPFKVKMYLVLAPVIALAISAAIAFGKNKNEEEEKVTEDTFTYANPDAYRTPVEPKAAQPSQDDNFGYFNEASKDVNNEDN